MTIYFTAAISQTNDFGQYYQRIVKYLKQHGYRVLHDHITNFSLKDIEDETDEERMQYYGKVLKWISSCDLVVSELSFPSTINVGHEISIALEKGKPVIGMHFKGKNSIFLQGVQSDRLVYVEYSDKDLEDVLESSLDFALQKQDIRFNFFVSPEIQQYLDWVAKYKRTPRAVYLRELLEKDMKENKDWKKQK